MDEFVSFPEESMQAFLEKWLDKVEYLESALGYFRDGNIKHMATGLEFLDRCMLQRIMMFILELTHADGKIKSTEALAVVEKEVREKISSLHNENNKCILQLKFALDSLKETQAQLVDENQKH